MIIYLAAPYTANEDWLMTKRYHKVNCFAAKLAEAGYSVFSPITQGHNMARYMAKEIRTKSGFWVNLFWPMLEKSDHLVVLQLDGWQDSKGLQEEIRYAKSVDMPITLFDYEERKCPIKL